jgi:hypothetical protein
VAWEGEALGALNRLAAHENRLYLPSRQPAREIERPGGAQCTIAPLATPSSVRSSIPKIMVTCASTYWTLEEVSKATWRKRAGHWASLRPPLRECCLVQTCHYTIAFIAHRPTRRALAHLQAGRLTGRRDMR